MLKPFAWMIPIGVIVFSAGAVTAQDYPSKPIRIITGTAGGGSDFITRQLAQGITGSLGQSIVVDNRPGSLFGEVVLTTPPDGYTVFIGGANLWTIPLMVKSPYDVERDYAPISLLAREVKVLAVHPSLPTKSVKDLIALAKAKPGELNFASGALGATSQIAGELFKTMARVNIVWVPYKSNAAAATSVMSGETQLTFGDPDLILPHVKSGKLKALAITSATPSAVIPGLPTIAATGLSGYEVTGVTGFWAPAKTPVAIINRLNREVVRVLNLTDVKERMLNAWEDVVASSPEQFAAAIRADIVNMSKVLKDTGIKN